MWGCEGRRTLVWALRRATSSPLCVSEGRCRGRSCCCEFPICWNTDRDTLGMSHLEKLLPPKDALPEGESKSAEDNQTVSLFSLDPDRLCKQRTKRRAGGGNIGLPRRAVRVASEASPWIQCISTPCAEALRSLNAFRDRFLLFFFS